MKINDPRIVEKNSNFYMRTPKQLVRLAKGRCTICASEFFYRNANKSSHEFCSVECRGLSDRGSGNPNWKGGRSIHTNGYMRVYTSDNMTSKDTKGRILEHRYVMEKHLGRPLTIDETVHHINGDRADNRIENLELYSSRHPKGQRVKDQIEWAKEILAKYGHL